MKIHSALCVATASVLLLTSCESGPTSIFPPLPPLPPINVNVAPAPGGYVRTLPVGYRPYYYRGRTYYTYNNVYYRPHRRYGYVVVRRPY